MTKPFAAMVVAAALSVGACSQVAVLAPVASPLTSVRAAALDVLTDQQIDIMTAPVCTVTGKDISCLGETFDGQVITVAAAGDGDMSVAVGDRSLYAGSVQDVLDAHGRSS